MSHIDLLGELAFKNQAPHVVIQEALDKRVEDKVFRFQGRFGPAPPEEEPETTE